MVVARGEHALAYGHGNLFQLGPVELLDGSVEGITVKVHDGLAQVATELELCDVVVCTAQI